MPPIACLFPQSGVMFERMAKRMKIARDRDAFLAADGALACARCGGKLKIIAKILAPLIRNSLEAQNPIRDSASTCPSAPKRRSCRIMPRPPRE